MKNRICLFLILSIVAGCSMFRPSKDVSVFYTLGGHEYSKSDERQNPDFKPVIINLVIDEIPAYSDCPQIVTKSEGQILKFSEINRWGEPFEYGCLRAINAALSHNLTNWARIITTIHADRNKVFCDYRVSISLNEIIYNENTKSVFLDCTWSLFDYERKQEIYLTRFSTIVPIEGNGSLFHEIVCATRESLLKLSESIASDLVRLIEGNARIVSKSD